MAEKKFDSIVVLSSFRTTKTGDYFNIADNAMFSLNKYTFDQFAAGNYSSITFTITDQQLDPVKDAAGNERPRLFQTVVASVEKSSRAGKLKDIDDARLDYELKDIKKKTKDLGELV